MMPRKRYATPLGLGWFNAPSATDTIPGLVEPGNIDIYHRPIVHNPDGSISTVRSMSFGTDRGEMLLPSVSDEGTILPDSMVVPYWRRKQRHLGIFKDVNSADAYAEKLHLQQQAFYDKNKKR